jgi:flagellar biosynthesis regulator FlbT
MAIQSSQSDEILATLARMESSLKPARMFDALETMRDEVQDVKRQLRDLRGDMMDLQRTIYEHMKTTAD